jgi:hypothetical protein
LCKGSNRKVTGVLSFGGILRHDVPAKEIVAVVKEAAGHLNF